MRCHSSQGQRVQQEGPDSSRLNSALQQQWDHAANAHLGNIAITPGSNKKVWWICDQCPDGHLHRWETTVAPRTRGTGCPQCSGRKVCKHNCLATKAPWVAAQWDYTVNDGTPDSTVAQSNQLVGWLSLHHLTGYYTAIRQAVRTVLGRLLANATPCKP